MGYKVINKQVLADGIKRVDVHAPELAHKILPGQFVMVSPDEEMTSIPLDVADTDLRKGTIALIFQENSKVTIALGAVPIGETIPVLLGPLGNPSKVEKVGVVICIATGIGAARILPVCRAFKDKGNKVVSIIGAKTKKALMLEAQIRLASSKIYIATNDGSYERKGLATDLFKKLLEEEKADVVHAAGSVEMMRSITQLCKEKNKQIRVHLNPLIVDGTGLCGSCRVKVGGKDVLACLDGPEFDGKKVDFDDLSVRMNAFKENTQCTKSQSSPQENEPGTFGKLLSGILKK